MLVLERDRFPRFHIGESQLPWTNELLRTLGVYDTIAGEGFVEKWGASFWTHDATVEQYADFSAAAATPTPRTFQVPRARFDELLLRHAARSGSHPRATAGPEGQPASGSTTHMSPARCWPPVTSSVAPVVHDDAGEARNTIAAATSSTVPRRPATRTRAGVAPR